MGHKDGPYTSEKGRQTWPLLALRDLSSLQEAQATALQAASPPQSGPLPKLQRCGGQPEQSLLHPQEMPCFMLWLQCDHSTKNSDRWVLEGRRVGIGGKGPAC